MVLFDALTGTRAAKVNMRRLVLVGLCAFFALVSGAPSKAELRSKTLKQLKAILKSKGAKCKKCMEKDDYVDRVIETWDWAPKEASDPGGGISMQKDQFIGQLKEAYKRQRQQEASGGHEVDDDVDPNLPDFEKVWADFATKLSSGEIGKDDNGQLKYEVGNMNPAWYEQYKIPVMMFLNIVLLWWMQKVRRRERAENAAAKAAKAADQAADTIKDEDKAKASEEPETDKTK